jgi:predicted lipoprotein with Yx(FWY)xxD motif
MKNLNHAISRTVQISALAISMSLIACSSSNDNSSTEQDDNPGQPAGDNAAGLGNISSTAIGDVLSFGPALRTAYTFANDVDGVSNCSGVCLANWPAVPADATGTDGQFSTITRDDGSLQRTFKNRPLYYFQGDASEGEVNGEGLSGVWYAARLDPISTGDTSLGTVLVGRGTIGNGSEDPAARNNVDGLTLYTFQNDTTGVSNCNGDCAVAWPPLFADKGSVAADSFTLITRNDGTIQWAVNGQALYFFQGDAAAGDTTGDGIGGVWDVALPPAE